MIKQMNVSSFYDLPIRQTVKYKLGEMPDGNILNMSPVNGLAVMRTGVFQASIQKDNTIRILYINGQYKTGIAMPWLLEMDVNKVAVYHLTICMVT